MAQEKISEYGTSVTALAAGDEMDVSKLISTGPNVYQSQKLDYSVLLTELNADLAIDNLSTTNLAQSATIDRTYSLGADTVNDTVKFVNNAGATLMGVVGDGYTIQAVPSSVIADASLDNNTISFYTDGSTLKTRYKNGAGVASDLSPDSGSFGISDSAGAITYYDDMTAATAAAVSGDVIQQYSNVSYPDLVDKITMPAGVSFNGRGYTMTFTNVGVYAASRIIQLSTGISHWINSNVVYTGGGANAVFACSNGFINFTGTTLVTNGTSALGAVAPSITSLKNLEVTATASKGILAISGGCNFDNCKVTSSDTGIEATATTDMVISCEANTTGSANALVVSNSENCKAHSVGGIGARINGVTNNLTAESDGSYGLQLSTDTAKVSGAYIRSTHANGGVWATSGGSRLTHSTIIATAGPAYKTDAVAGTGEREVYFCHIESQWNNASGHGVELGIANVNVKHNDIIVANASANCIYAGSAINAYFLTNGYDGATTAVNANVTNLVTNTADGQGNILK